MLVAKFNLANNHGKRVKIILSLLGSRRGDNGLFEDLFFNHKRVRRVHKDHRKKTLWSWMFLTLW